MFETFSNFGTSLKQFEFAHVSIKIWRKWHFATFFKTPNYIYRRKKKISLFVPYMAFYVLCWTYVIPRSLLIWLNALCCFFILPLFRCTLFRKHQFLKELLWKYFLACLIRFLCLRGISVNLIVFAINNVHKQLYVKDS